MSARRTAKAAGSEPTASHDIAPRRTDTLRVSGTVDPFSTIPAPIRDRLATRPDERVYLAALRYYAVLDDEQRRCVKANYLRSGWPGHISRRDDVSTAELDDLERFLDDAERCAA